MDHITSTSSSAASSTAAKSAAAPADLPQPRQYGAVNWVGVSTLYGREVHRFMKIWMQTLFAPIITSLLFVLVFAVALKRASPPASGISYVDFLAPGLIMMGILNNAFANSSSSLIQAKLMGTAADFLMPPLTPIEQTLAFVLGTATRGLLVGAVTAAVLVPFADMQIQHWWAVIYFALMASMMMGSIGVFGGLWAEKFDHLAAITNFAITPLTFLSGTFYFIRDLPEPFYTLSHFNPIFYLIDGFRYGFLGIADGDIRTGMIFTGALSVVMLWASYQMFRTGYRLKT